MKNEIKIVLPLYKIIYSILFITFLAIFRGIADSIEIGATLDPMMSALSIVFMADTYLIEKRELRWEIFALYALDKKIKMVYRRLFIQFAYLFLAAAIGYFIFFVQNPSIGFWKNEGRMYLDYLLAVSVSILFWGIISIAISNLFQNIWCGMGISLILWLGLNSKGGDILLGKYNIFSYVFRSYERGAGNEWIQGKIVGLILSIFIIIAVLPQTMKRKERI